MDLLRTMALVVLGVLFALFCAKAKNVSSNISDRISETPLILENKNEDDISPKIISLDELLKLGKTVGISAIEEYATPNNLLYLNSNISNELIDIEFKNSFVSERSNSTYIYDCDIPEITKEFAKANNNKYAASKLFEYYQKLPKYIKSDTIYHAYHALDELLAIFVEYHIPGLKERLLNDFHEWQNLAEHHIQSPDIKNSAIDSLSFKENSNYQENYFYANCNLIMLQIAGALNKLGVSEFDNKKMNELKKLSNEPNYQFYRFKKIYSNPKLSHKSVTLDKKYLSIESFVKDSHGLNLIFNHLDTAYNSKIKTIIFDESSNSAYIDLDYLYGETLYIIKLKNKTFSITPFYYRTDSIDFGE